MKYTLFFVCSAAAMSCNPEKVEQVPSAVPVADSAVPCPCVSASAAPAAPASAAPSASASVEAAAEKK